MDGLFGSWLYIVLHIVNLAVLVFLLRLIIYKPMKKFMAKRQEELEHEVASLDEAAAKSEGARALLEQKEKELEQKQRRVYYEAMQKASASADELIKAAQKDADAIIDQAERRADEIKQGANEEIREAAAVMAVDIAAAVLPGKLSKSEHEELLEASVAEAKKYG